MGKASLVLGIVAVVFGFIPLLGVSVAVPCALVGLPLGIVGFFDDRKAQRGFGMSTAGTVLCVVAMAVSIAFAVLVFSAIDEAVGGIDEPLAPLPTPSAEPLPTAAPTNTPAPSDTPTPTAAPTNTPAPSDTPTPTAAPTNTPAPRDTPTPTHTPLPTSTATPTAGLRLANEFGCQWIQDTYNTMAPVGREFAISMLATNMQLKKNSLLDYIGPGDAAEAVRECEKAGWDFN